MTPELEPEGRAGAGKAKRRKKSSLGQGTVCTASQRLPGAWHDWELLGQAAWKRPGEIGARLHRPGLKPGAGNGSGVWGNAAEPGPGPEEGTSTSSMPHPCQLPKTLKVYLCPSRDPGREPRARAQRGF